MRVGNLGRLYHLFHGGILHAEGNVVENGIVKEDGFLVHDAHHGPQVGRAEVADIGSVDGDLSLRGIIEPRNQVHQRGFAGARFAHDRDGFPFFDIQIDIEQDLPAVVVAETDIAEADFLAETIQFGRLHGLLDGIVGFEDLVDAFHGCESFRDGVAGLRELFQRVDDAVQDDHVVDEGRRVDGRVVREDERAAEPEDDADHDGAQTLAHRVSRSLADGDAVQFAPHGSRHPVEAAGHAFLGIEGLDDAQAAEGLFDLRHGIAPERLGFQRAAFELFADGPHDPAHDGNEDDGEQGQLPADEEQGAEVEENQDRVFDENLDGAGDGILHLLHVTAHAGDDVALLLLGEKADGKAQDLVVNLHADILHHTGADGNHHGRRAEIAGGLEDGGHTDEQAQQQENLGGADGL